MAQFIIRDPQSGRELQLTGDFPPTEAEIEELFARQAALEAETAPAAVQPAPAVAAAPEVAPVAAAAPAEPTVAERFPDLRPGGARGAGGEALLAIGSGAVAEPVSGLAGIAGLIAGLVPGGESPGEKAARFQAGTAEALTFQPRTRAGAAAVEAVGAGAEFLTEQARKPVAGIAGLLQLPTEGVAGAAETIRRTTEEGIGPTAGAALERAGAPPIVSTIAETLPIGLATVAGVKAPVRRVKVAEPGPSVVKPTATTPRSSVTTFLDELEAALPDAANPQQAVNLLRDRFPAEADRLGLLSRTGPEIREALAALKRGDQAAKAELAQRITEGAPVGPPLVTTEGPQVSVGRPRLDEPVDVTPPPSADSVVENLRKGKTEQLAQAVVPDTEIVEAAQRLGVDLNVEHYSTNTAFQGVARALKSRPSSELQVAEVQALRDLSTRADDLVTEIGGAIDKGAVSDDILNSTRATIDDLTTQADAAYTTVREAIPAPTRVQTTNISEFLDARLTDLGGDVSLLSTVERRLLKVIERGDDGTITYGALDRIRRDVGEGFSTRSGPFADDSQRVLRETYDVLSDTQNGAAEAFGVGEVYTEARALVAKRKGLEDQAVALFGRDVSGSLVPKIRAAATGLPKGDVTAFNRLIEALPEARRGEVAATVLGELFAAGSRQGGQLGIGFATTWRNLNRNTTARDTLLRQLPPEAAQRFQDIGRVIDGISRANAKPLANPSGSAAGIIAALEQGTIATKLYGAGQILAGEAAVGAIGGIPGLATVLRATTGRGKPNASNVRAADQFLGSQTFKDAVSAGLEGDLARANRIAENSPQFKRWIDTVPEETAAEIGRLGFISWLASEQGEQQ